MKRKIIIILLILISICAISHASASDHADNLTCDESDSISEIINEDQLNTENTYRNIQTQIDSASDGDTINLTGEYECDYIITVNKSVNIVGLDDGATIKWTGEGKNYSSPFFNINASNVVLNNIKFIGGTFTFGGALTWNGDNGSIINCEFKDCAATSDTVGIGGAIMMVGKNSNITNSKFTNNRANQHGGAILISGDNARITNCEFEDNSAMGYSGQGGALMIYANNCIVEKSNFTNNHAVNYGGAISVSNNTNKILGCTFTGNYITGELLKDQGGGAVNSYCIGLIIDNCIFQANNASKAVGGAINLAANNTVKNSFFKDNYAYGGKVANDIFASNTSTIVSNTFILPYKGLVNQSVYGIPEDDLLNASNVFNVTKIDSNVKFSAGMVFEYTRSGTISVSVEGGIIEAENIRVLGHPEAKITFINTDLTVSGLAVGEYTLRVTTTPDAYHNAVDGDLPIKVNQATAVIKASSVTVALKKGALWTISLVDSKTGNPISNMELTLYVYTGSKYATVKVTTNANGVASYQTKGLGQGTHKVVVTGSHPGYNFNTVTSTIKVIKQTQLKFKVKKNIAKDGSSLSITVMKGKKGIKGVGIKLYVYTGNKLTKTVTLKSKKKGKYVGVTGWGTNKLSVGNHKVVIEPSNIKYGGSKTVNMKIKKSAKKYPGWESKV